MSLTTLKAKCQKGHVLTQRPYGKIKFCSFPASRVYLHPMVHASLLPSSKPRMAHPAFITFTLTFFIVSSLFEFLLLHWTHLDNTGLSLKSQLISILIPPAILILLCHIITGARNQIVDNVERRGFYSANSLQQSPLTISRK